MITCKNCDTEYEDSSSYCNVCDLPLRDDSGESLENNSTNEATDVEEVLLQARKTASSVHRLLGSFYAIALVLIAALIFMDDTFSNSAYFFLLIIALPATIHFSAASGLVRNKAWARPLSIVIGILLLPGFPIGTILGIVILSQMFKKEWRLAAST